MENIYTKYYLPDEYVIKMLDDALIVFDTSALLDLYYYSEGTQSEILGTVFDKIDTRLWIPSQVEFEYLKNKDKVAGKPVQVYQSLVKKSKSGDSGYIEKILVAIKNFGSSDLKTIKNQLKTLKERTISQDKHPYLPEEIYEEVDTIISKFENELTSFQTAMENYAGKYQKSIDEKINELKKQEDRIAKTISKKFQVGKEISFEQMMEIAQEGEHRYKEQIPPGYEDADEKKGYKNMVIYLYGKKYYYMH